MAFGSENTILNHPNVVGSELVSLNANVFESLINMPAPDETGSTQNNEEETP